MMTPMVTSYLQNLGRSNAILYGLEAHVGVYQTCMDLREANYEVTIIVDATSSKKKYNRNTALYSMKNAGVKTMNVDALAVMMMKDMKNHI